MISPSCYSTVALPGTPEMEALESCKQGPHTSWTPLSSHVSFSTFGKRAGQKALREMQASSVSLPVDNHVYDEPLSPAKQAAMNRNSHHAYDEPISTLHRNVPAKARPLVDVSSVFDHSLKLNLQCQTSKQG